MQAREWSCNRTVEGRGSHPGLVYHTFTPLPVGLPRGLYIVLLEVHALAIMIKQNSLVRCSYLLAIQDILLWPLGTTLLLFQECKGGQLPGPVPKVPGEPAIAGPCVKGSKSTFTQWSLWGSVQLVLAARCYPGGQTSASVILHWFVLAVV